MEEAIGWVVSRKTTGGLQTGMILKKSGEGPLFIPFVHPDGDPIRSFKRYKYKITDFNWFLTLPPEEEGTVNHGNDLSVLKDLSDEAKEVLAGTTTFDSLQIIQKGDEFTVHTNEIEEGEVHYHELRSAPVDRKPKKVAVDLEED